MGGTELFLRAASSFKAQKNLAVGEVFLFLAYRAGYDATVKLSAVSSASMNSGTLMGLVR